jgi:3-hydroxybutyryl-CoA dehydrogenase
MSNHPYRQIGVAGSGAIATGLAALASVQAESVRLLARSEASCEKATAAIVKSASRIEGADSGRVSVTTEAADLSGCDLIVEAIVEDQRIKTTLLASLGGTAPHADLATTTSSLSVTALGLDSGQPERLFGLHVFNPVPVMELVEVILPEACEDGLHDRALEWCHGIGKTAVVVPDTAGFVVNRLLFPYLFDAVRLKESSGLDAKAIDTCMGLGVGHPMGPLALLDLVGLDVAIAIGEALNADSGNPDHLAPGSVQELADAGKLGRKTGSGFYEYD